MEMSIEGKRLKHNEFIILLSIHKGSVDINSYWLEKSEMRGFAFGFLTRNSNSEYH